MNIYSYICPKDMSNKNKQVCHCVGEFGDFFEGDMLLTNAQREAISEAMEPDSRNGLKDAAKRWPNRTVVYQIDEEDFGW